MTTSPPPDAAERAPVVETLFTDGERAALVGFLAGYGGLTRDEYTLDLRQYTSLCQEHGCTCSCQARGHRKRAG